MTLFFRLPLKITGADIWQSIQLLNENGIEVFDVRTLDALTAVVSIERSSVQSAIRVLKRRGDLVKTDYYTSVNQMLQTIKRRWALIAGILLLAFLEIVVPARILLVQVYGNSSVPQKMILEAAEDAGLRFWTSRREIRSEKIKNHLLSAVPELQWAGVNTYGCKAIISVKERIIAEEDAVPKHTVSNIVAGCDGVIRSVTVERGTILCAESETVKEGQLLISGYTDCGSFIQASRAEGEIIADTIRQIKGVSPEIQFQKDTITGKKKNYSLIIGKKRINLYKDSGIWDATCDRIGRQYTLKLPGGFVLPVSICCETVISYSVQPAQRDMALEKKMLGNYISGYVHLQMIAGKVNDAKETFRQQADCIFIDAEYSCTEMIGRERLEKNGDLYG